MSENGYKAKNDYKKFFPESEREIELKIGDIFPVGGQFYTVINENDPGKDERKIFVILKGAYRQDKEHPNTWHKIIMCSRLMSNKELALLFAATKGCPPDDDY